MVTVVDAVTRELGTLGADESALGASAVALARRLDDPETSAQAAAAAAREIRETLAVLRAAADTEDGDRMTVYERDLRAVS